VSAPAASHTEQLFTNLRCRPASSIYVFSLLFSVCLSVSLFLSPTLLPLLIFARTDGSRAQYGSSFVSVSLAFSSRLDKPVSCFYAARIEHVKGQGFRTVQKGRRWMMHSPSLLVHHDAKDRSKGNGQMSKIPVCWHRR
jgi:hypothetical protein